MQVCPNFRGTLRGVPFYIDEDALEVGPGALHLEPDSDDRVRGGQLLPPVGDLLKEVAH